MPTGLAPSAHPIGLFCNAFHFSRVEYRTQGITLAKWRKTPHDRSDNKGSRSSDATASRKSDCYKMNALAPKAILKGNLLGRAAFANRHGADARGRKRRRDHKADRAGICCCRKLLGIIRLYGTLISAHLGIALALRAFVALVLIPGVTLARIAVILVGIWFLARTRHRRGTRPRSARIGRRDTVAGSITARRGVVTRPGIIGGVSPGIGRTARGSTTV